MRLGRNSQVEHVVRRVTRRHENTLSLRCLVDWAVVRLVFGKVLRLARLEPHERAFSEEDLEITLDERVLVIAPLAAFKEHASDDDAVVRLGWVRINNHLEVVIEQINGYVVLSSIVLQGTSDESLREEEASDPQDVGQAVALPVSEPLEPFEQIFGVATKTLQRWEALGEPHSWNLANLQAVERGFKLSR